MEKKEIIEKLNELVLGLQELENFSDVFDSLARNSPYTKHCDYVNGVISMLSMQSAKVRELIGIAEKLEKESH